MQQQYSERSQGNQGSSNRYGTGVQLDYQNQFQEVFEEEHEVVQD